MKFVSVRDLRGKSRDIWKSLQGEREMVITSNGRPIALLVSVNENTLEESLSAFRRARAMDAVEALQRHSIRAGTDKLTSDDINTEVQSVRKNRSL